MRDVDVFFRMLGPMIGVVVFLLPTLLMAFAVPYAVLRIRDSRNESPDSQLGLKAGLHFFFSCGIFLALSGATTILVYLMTRDNNRFRGPAASGLQEEIRVGLAFIIAGFLIGLFHFVLLILATNELQSSPTVRRTFVGWRLAVHGIVLMACITAMCLILLWRNPDWRTFRGFLAISLVWGPSWFGHLVLLCVRARDWRPARPRSESRPYWEEDG